MTRRAGSKKRTRARAEREGVAYNAARRREEIEAGSVRRVGELLSDAIASWCERQLDKLLDDVAGNLAEDIEPITGLLLDEAAVHQLTAQPEMTYSEDVDEYDGGTVAMTAFADAELVLEGLMAKADAFSAADSGTVTVIDPDWNRHSARVLVEGTVMLELEFNAIASPADEAIEDFELVAARPRDLR